MIYLVATTDDPEKNVARVTLRYETGTTTGHYVAPQKVRERYLRILNLLPKAAEIADAVFVYDNSVDYEKATLQAMIDVDTGLSVAATAKPWVHQRLIRPLQEREEQFEELVLESRGRNLVLMEVNELNGIYSGSIIAVNRNFVLISNEVQQQASIYDRRLLETSHEGNPISYVMDCIITMHYADNDAPIVTTKHLI